MPQSFENSTEAFSVQPEVKNCKKINHAEGRVSMAKQKSLYSVETSYTLRGRLHNL